MSDGIRLAGEFEVYVYNEDGSVDQHQKFSNLITTAGDTHVAERLAQQTPTKDFTGSLCRLYLGNPGTPVTPAKGSDYSITVHAPVSVLTVTQAPDSGYPVVPDLDGDNTGSGATVCSFRWSYSGASFDTSADGDAPNGVSEMGLIESGASGTDAIFNVAVAPGDFTAWTKTSLQTAKVFYNVTLLGA